MKVHELISNLLECDADAKVRFTDNEGNNIKSLSVFVDSKKDEEERLIEEEMIVKKNVEIFRMLENLDVTGRDLQVEKLKNKRLIKKVDISGGN